MNIRVMADEDTVAGFRLAGVPGIVVRNAREARRELDRLQQEAPQIVVVTTEQIANSIREEISGIRFGEEFPLIVEIPGREGPSEESPSLERMIREAVGISF
jgi:V/A-type H+-transporting ATPase subunit F